ncbi:MAG: SpoIID/LytB domain-containing protein [Bacteroidota bacterium]
MILKIFIGLLLLFAGHLSVSAVKIPEIVDVGILYQQHITGFSFSPENGSYSICDEQHRKIAEVQPHSELYLEITPEGFTITKNDTIIATEKRITFQGASFSNTFFISRSPAPFKGNAYSGDLTVFNKNGSFQFINHVPFESYVAGTVETESGLHRHPEFYKVQAVVIRTYALKNFHRHKKEGFDLCDKVHCQAYHGRSSCADIANAVYDTKGEVLVDTTGRVLNTVYHANCGGETTRSQDLWVEEKPYLQSQTDHFCKGMPGSEWKITIPQKTFRNFVEQNLGKKLSDSLWHEMVDFQQPYRKIFLDPEHKINLRMVREYFGLRSTFFSLEKINDQIHFSGKGYGHGVGLCQEGAMNRAKNGHSKEEILMFYYKNSLLMTMEPEEAVFN